MDELTPITRIETFLDAIINNTAAPNPITRIEVMLNDIINGNVVSLTPITRIECFLANISGAGNAVPMPITRIEVFLAKKSGMDIETPTPITRIEVLLDEWVGGTPSQTLTVTGISPLSLVNAIAHKLVSLTQTGKCEQASTPTPSSPVDIVCNNGAVKWGREGIYADGTPEVITLGEHTANAVNLYGIGEYADTQEVISGAVARNMQVYVLDGTEEWTFIADNYQDGTHRIHWDGFRTSANISTSDPPILCSHFVKAPLADRSVQTGQDGKCYISSISFHIRSTEFTSLADAKAWLAAQYAKGTPVIIVCPLREPTTEHVAPQSLSTVEGTNTLTVTANVSDIPLTVEYKGISE